ncbi:MAG: carbonic anhydrases/acetyltransferase, isoleucine patch superfamily [uncultured archaeon A07HB70]|jgi:Carbonic anhydrases/acetyltransferases, isoleucine patch superfamily|nr:MAG: carbonic anhydrases/acetyltransferase, isoleucine patch superfamily [uncultured archaeon A07HB70]
MVLRSFEGTEPDVAESARVDDAAVVIGDVRIGPEASVWPNATLRGDHGRLVVGERANVQDGATLHETVELGPGATVGHTAVVHDATVRERAMVGMGSVVLDGAVVGERALVGAGAVVTEETAVPSDTLVAGAPAEVVKEVDPEESRWTTAGDRYVELARRHAAGSERIG